MKYDCEIVQDLMPLVLDGIASDKSVKLVNEHTQECVICSRFYESLSHDIHINAVVDMNEQTLYESESITTYGKRIKKRRIMTIIAVALGIVILLIVQAIIILGSVGALSFFGKEYRTTDPAQYGIYRGHISNEASGMFSNLLIFPSKLPGSAHIEDYYYYCSDKGLDSSYQIILEYSLSAEDFQKEKQRLSNLSITYKDKTNKVLYDTTGFNYPAYVTVFNDNETYEYALLDTAKNRIIYVFSQFQDLDESQLDKNYLPSEISVSGSPGYSMYYFPSVADNGSRVKPQLNKKD
jgi:hypothetical protein